MNLIHLAKAALDPKNLAIAGDLMGHVRGVLGDGKVEKRECIDAAKAFADDVIEQHGDPVVVTVPKGKAELIGHVNDAKDRIGEELMTVLSDRNVTASEIGYLVHFAAHRVMDVVEAKTDEAAAS